MAVGGLCPPPGFNRVKYVSCRNSVSNLIGQIPCLIRMGVKLELFQLLQQLLANVVMNLELRN